MPTRYLKPGICDSDKFERLQNPQSEALYYRLLTNVDDFGRLDARPLVVKAKCLPLREKVTSEDVKTMLADLHNAGLIVLYVVDGKEYLQFTGWDNKPRADESKFPQPPANADKCMQIPTVLPVTVTVTGTKTGTGTETARKRAPAKTPLPKDFEISDRVKQWAERKGYDRLDEHLESFVSKSRAKGYTYADWNEGLMGAIRDDWAGLRKGNSDAFAEAKRQIFGERDITDESKRV